MSDFLPDRLAPAYNSIMILTSLNFIFLLMGLLAAVVINTLADYLPSSTVPLLPQVHTWNWRVRKRPLLVFGFTAVLFFSLPFWLTEPADLFFNAIYIAILILIIVTDLEHKLIFNAVVYPGTILAFIGSFFVSSDENSPGLALLGAVVGLLIFGGLYLLANFLYGGDRIPLGLGDVKLAMMLGAMLGFHRIFFCLFWAIILGGVVTLILLLTRLVDRRTALPYGQYLAISGIIFLIWGADYVKQFIN